MTKADKEQAQEEMVTINFKVTKDYRKEIKKYAANLDKSMTDIFYEAMELHKQKYS